MEALSSVFLKNSLFSFKGKENSSKGNKNFENILSKHERVPGKPIVAQPKVETREVDYRAKPVEQDVVQDDSDLEEEGTSEVTSEELGENPAQTSIEDVEEALDVIAEILQLDNDTTEELKSLLEGAGNLEGLMDSLKELAALLKDITQVKGVATSLKGVATQVKDAAAQVKDAATPLKGVATQVKDVATPLKDAATQLKDAAAQVKDAATPLKDAAAQVKDAATQVKDAATQVKDAATQVKDAATPLKDVATQLEDLKPEKLQGLLGKIQKVIKGAFEKSDLPQEQAAKLTQDIKSFIKNEMSPLLKGASQEAKSITQGSLPDVEVMNSDKAKQGAKFEDLGDMAKAVKKVVIKTDSAAESKHFHENYKSNGNDPKTTAKSVLPDQAQQFNSKQGKNQNGGQSPEKGLDTPAFMKKMKSVLKSHGGEKGQEPPAFQPPAAKAFATAKPRFINKLVTGRFLHQMVSKIQSMVNAKSNISASIDLKSLDFGDMKLAAEVTGSKLSIKLAGIGQALNPDVIALKGELELELKNLGFDEVEIDFGGAGQESRGGNPFEQEIQRQLARDAVKLPGDYLADIGKIDEWLKGFEEVS